jgi:hypothetical protein
MSQGVLAASFTVSGTSFKISADGLRGSGFVLYGGAERTADKAVPVAVVGFRSVVLDNFCQSVFLSRVPLVGDVTLRMTSTGMTDLGGDLTLITPELGVDAARLAKGPPGARGEPRSFGMQADEARAASPRMIAWSAAAQTISLKNLALSMRTGRHECF